jgi:dynein heavy chain
MSCQSQRPYENVSEWGNFFFDALKNIQEQLQDVIKTKKSILAQLSPILLKAFKPHIDKLDKKIQPGMTALIWNSLNIQPYIDEIYIALANLQDLVDKINSIYLRVNLNISKISELCIAESVETRQWTIEMFIEIRKSVLVLVDHYQD